jgi:hypothetical protein
MFRARWFFALVAIGVVSLLSGCASKMATFAAEAEPISVKVTPTIDSTSFVAIEVTFKVATTVASEVLYFYDVRDLKASDPDRHLDADGFVTLSESARNQNIPSGTSKWTITVPLNSSRSTDTELYVTAVAAKLANRRGAVGAASIPMTGSE